MNDRQESYAQNRARGLNRARSAVLSGYGEDSHAGEQVEESLDVRLRIQELQKETSENAGVTKDMVAEGLKEAAALAKTLADPTGMVAAWRELGKLLGFYAPEVKKLERGINKQELKKAIEDLSDEELLQLSRGRVVEGQVLGKTEETVPLLPAK